MDWETGVITVNAIAVILTVLWAGLKISAPDFNKINIEPLVMWFKMFSIIAWITFFGLLFIYCFIGV